MNDDDVSLNLLEEQLMTIKKRFNYPAKNIILSETGNTIRPVFNKERMVLPTYSPAFLTVNQYPKSPDDKVIAIVVTDKGYVEHKTMDVANISLDELQKTVDLINKLLLGTPIDEINRKLEIEIKPIISKYVEQHEAIYNAFCDVFYYKKCFFCWQKQYVKPT